MTLAEALNDTSIATPYFQGVNRCFYTGMPLDDPERPLKKTVEHLVPQNALNGSRLNKRDYAHSDFRRVNEVPCSEFMNSIVGNAPLAVKFAVRECMLSLAVHPRLSHDAVIATYARAAKALLETYRIEGHKQFPWQWKSEKENKSLRKKLKAAYKELLTAEERDAGMWVFC